MKWYVKLTFILVILVLGIGAYHYYLYMGRGSGEAEVLPASQRFGDLFISPSAMPTPIMSRQPPTPSATYWRTSVPYMTYPPENSGYVDLNQATAADLTQLGIDEVLAKRIVDNRLQYGPFVRKEDLLRVRGMTYELLDEIWDFIFTYQS